MNGVCAAIAVEETKKSVADSIGRLQYTRIIPIVMLVLHPEIDSSESRSARILIFRGKLKYRYTKSMEFYKEKCPNNISRKFLDLQ